jgi:hypothetical protein
MDSLDFMLVFVAIVLVIIGAIGLRTYTIDAMGNSESMGCLASVCLGLGICILIAMAAVKLG